MPTTIALGAPTQAVPVSPDAGGWTLFGGANALNPPDDESTTFAAGVWTGDGNSFPFGKNLSVIRTVTIPIGASVIQISTRIRGQHNRSTPPTLAMLNVTPYVVINGTPFYFNTLTSVRSLTGLTWVDDSFSFNVSPAQLVLGSSSVDVGLGFVAQQVDPETQAWLTTVEIGVTYNSPPLAPTLNAPSGSVGSLTPQFTGVHSDPDGDPMNGVEIEVRRVSDNALMWSSGMVGTGTFNRPYAGSTLTSGVQYRWRARTRDNSGASNNVGAWSEFTTFTPVTNAIPVASIISPTGNATVGTLTPTLQFSYSDPEGDAQSGYQVQVRRFNDQVSFWDPGQQAGAVTSVVYAGTTLVGGTRYEWRVRVQDSKGAWSDYTGWASFTPQAAPNPPTITSPSGLINTLTPTIQGTYNQASGASQAAYQYEIRQGGVTIYASGDVAGAFGTGQSYGTDNPSDIPSTPPALAWGTAYEIRARSKDTNGAYSAFTAWQAFTTNAAPTTPTNLQPNGAVTGNTTPALSWTHNDPNADAQTEAEIELEEVGVGFVTGYGPKLLTQSTTSHTVTETLTASPATEYRWRVRTKGTAGPGFGPWSSWATFTVATAPQFVIDNPVPAQVVVAPQLPVQWTMSGGSGTQQSWRVRIFGSDQIAVVHDSGVQSGIDGEYVLPTGVLKNGLSYHVRVSGEDTLDQAAQSGLVEFTTAWTPPATITGLQAQSIGSQE